MRTSSVCVRACLPTGASSDCFESARRDHQKSVRASVSEGVRGERESGNFSSASSPLVSSDPLLLASSSSLSPPSFPSLSLVRQYIFSHSSSCDYVCSKSRLLF